MIEFFTKENISLLIAILSFFLTVGQLLYGIYQRRTNIDISIENCEIGEYSTYTRYILTLMVHNHSSAPAIITKMYLDDICCRLRHQWTGEQYYPSFTECDLPRTERLLSVDFPINMVPHSSILERVVFDFSNEDNLPSRLTTIHVITTKKKKIFSVLLPAPNSNPFRI